MSTLIFPKDLGTAFTMLNFKEFQYTGITGDGNHSTPALSTGSIILPLPKSLQDSLNVKVGGDELGILGSISGDISAGVAGASVSDLLGRIGAAVVRGADEVDDLSKITTLAEASSTIGDTGQFIVGAGLGLVGPDLAKGIGVGRGTAINPYATLVFTGVDLKTHTFEWTLSPSNEIESNTIKEIIRTIQKNIVPEVAGVALSAGNNTLSRGLLRYPSMVDVTFSGVDFYNIKTSMISAFAVDYTPEGLAILKQGRPAMVRLTMTMTEAVIHTKDDYKKSFAPDGAGVNLALNEIVVTAQRRGFDSTGEPLVTINTTGNASSNSDNIS